MEKSIASSLAAQVALCLSPLKPSLVQKNTKPQVKTEPIASKFWMDALIIDVTIHQVSNSSVVRASVYNV